MSAGAGAGAEAAAGSELDALLQHERVHDIRFDEQSRVFRGPTGRIVPGLVPKLKASFFPNYRYASARRPTNRKRTDIKRRGDGLKRGKTVHHEIEILTNEGPRGLRKRGRRSIHPYTRKIAAALQIWQWRPVVSELAVHDPAINIATKADLICLDSKGRMILVELKTGFDNDFLRGTGSMHGPLAGRVSNAPLNQAKLQALVTKSIIESHGIHVHQAAVVQVHCDGISRFTVDREFLNCTSQIVSRLIDAKEAKAKACRRKR